MKRCLLLLPLTLLLVQCHKNSPDPAKPEDQLPAATQTGAGTFGCLLNGQPWTPSGGGLLGTPNLLLTYDPSYHGGNLVLTAYRLVTSGTDQKQYIGFGGDQIGTLGTYTVHTPTAFPPSEPQSVGFYDDSKSNPCNDYNNFILHAGTTTTGHFTLTRLDKQQGIVSGTFEFTLTQPGCDTIKITNGRFDYKL